MEIGWADMCRTPIIIVMEESNVHRHKMIEDVAGFIVETLEEGIEIAKTILCPQPRA